MVMGMPEAGFAYTKGTPKGFRRSDLEGPVTREFCPECGTHLLSKAPSLPGVALLWPLVVARWVHWSKVDRSQ